MNLLKSMQWQIAEMWYYINITPNLKELIEFVLETLLDWLI